LFEDKRTEGDKTTVLKPKLFFRGGDCPPKLCDGIRLQIIHKRKNIIKATILTEYAKEETAFFFQCTINIMSLDYPFQFERLRLPVKLRFAMIINKAQCSL
jgi:hypothetical protein